MQQNDKPVLIYSTFRDQETAEAAGRALVEQGLAACVNVLPGMISIYRWQGELQRDTECVLIIKTRRELADEAIAEGRRRHTYENAAFLVLPVEGGAPDYVAWLLGTTGTRS